MGSAKSLKDFSFMKKVRIVIWIIMLIGILGFLTMEVIPVYDADEAAESLGRTYDFSDGWEWNKKAEGNEDDENEEISFPYIFPAQ